MFSLDSLWTLDYILAPLPPLGIGLSLAVGEGGEGGVNSSALGKPMYQLLASYYAYKCSKSLWLVVVVETYFSVQLKSRPS